jgi:methionyl-tRNA formyltransferase
MRIVILSGNRKSFVTEKTIERMLEIQDVEVVGVLYRKIFSIDRIKVELKLGPSVVFRKVIQKFVMPKLTSFFKKKRVMKKEKVECDDVMNFHHPESLQQIAKWDPDLILFTGGGIIKKDLIDIPKLGVLNCHIGILPRYRGMYPYVWAILDGNEDLIGCSVHYIDEGIDTGAIVYRKYLDTSQIGFDDLIGKLEGMIPHCFHEAVQNIISGSESITHQKSNDGLQYYIPHEIMMQKARNKYDSK